MPESASIARSVARRTSPPWTLAGAPDPGFDDADRRINHALLTDPELTRRFRRRYPDCPLPDYDEMIRALGYVWECRYDGTVNVTGYCCAICDEPRGLAEA